MKPHKHADVLRAIADGKEVQFKNQIAGGWAETNRVNPNPITRPELEWRIKPELNPDVVVVRHVCILNGNEFYSTRFEKPNVRYVFDGETGKLKSVEVLK